MKVAKYFATKRAASGLSQTALAGELRVDQSIVSRVESASRQLSLTEALQWIQALGLNPAETLEDLAAIWSQSSGRRPSLWK